MTQEHYASILRGRVDAVLDEEHEGYTKHVHHWRLAEPSGTLTAAHCIVPECGAERAFQTHHWTDMEPDRMYRGKAKARRWREERL